jgi:hypothetical protein
MTDDGFDVSASAEEQIFSLLSEPDSFANLVGSLPDHPSTTALKVWGAIRGFYSLAQLPAPSASGEPIRTYPHPATRQ